MIWRPSGPLSWEPATPHRLLQLHGEQTGSVSVTVRVGAAWRPREPAASFPFVPVMGRDWNQTPPSAHPSPIYSKQFSLLPRPPSHPSQTLPPRSPFARQDSRGQMLPAAATPPPRSRSLPAAEGSLGALGGSLGVGPRSRRWRVWGQIQGPLQPLGEEMPGTMVSRSLEPLRHSTVPRA